MPDRPTVHGPLDRGRSSVRAKILSLVAAAALAPALLVGAASYYTAESILLEKTNAQLANRTESVVRGIDSWLAERRQDVEIFGSSSVVADNLPRAAAGQTVPASRTRDYLRQVQERFPLYRTLAVVDASGRMVARAGSVEPLPPSETAGSTVRILWREADGSQPLLHLEQPIRGRGDARVGTLVAVGALGSLWQRLLTELGSDVEELRLAIGDVTGTLTPRSAAPVWETSRLPGLDRCRGKSPVVSRYRSSKGMDVLGACRAVDAVDLVVIAELEAKTAFASVRELRAAILLIALLGALLVTALGYALVVRLVRPVEALIEGARAVSAGDYAHEVKISSRDELGYLGAVFNEMTQALHTTHLHLEQIARTDQLTGLYNRRHLDVALDVEVERARRDKTPLGVLMLDVDHFKNFNDRFGHPEGDALLRAIADLLREQLRPTDTVARYGGEEFTVLLPRSPRGEATRIAERLRCQLEELSSPRGASTTGSFGLAIWPDDGATGAELIAAADAALYEAKRLGRNRIVLAGTAEVKG
jgi:diguanylate cyclase (GGDEF)-like protein